MSEGLKANSEWTWENQALLYKLPDMCQMKCNADRCKVILHKNKHKQKMSRIELQQKDFETDLEEMMVLAQKMVWW